MNIKTHMKLLTFLLFSTLAAFSQQHGTYNAIYSGVPWFDDRGNVISAHGANIVRDAGRYYLFGEKHSDTSNAFAGFNCYSSKDLYNWKFENLALPVQRAGKLGPNRVGERPKVMKCPSTGEYLMFMHVDTLGYVDQYIGYATSNNITGPYTFRGPLLFNGKPIRRWDMGTFQDRDGSGYVLIHGGAIYKLADDYRSLVQQVNQDIASGFESPAIFRKDSLYYFLGSHLTSWERNDNDYYTATSLSGPWTKRGLFCPEGTLTWNSQTSFVLPVDGSKGTTFMFMGDRWAFPRQQSAATYVWQPLTVSGTSVSIPRFYEGWRVNTSTGKVKMARPARKMIENADHKRITYSGTWKHTTDSISLTSSDKTGDSFTVTFTGRQLALYGLSRPDGGYAKVDLKDAQGKVLLSAMIDTYCKYAVASLEYITPVLPESNYSLTVTVVGEHGNWTDKRRNVYGSKGNFVSLDKVLIND